MTNPAAHIGQFFVQIDGSDLPGYAIGSLDEAIVEDDLAQAAMFELRFNDPQLKLLDGDLFRLGAEVRLGAQAPAGQSKRLLVGEITAVEPHMEQHNVALVVRGYNRSHRLRRGSKTRTFLRQSDAEIARQIAREAGLSADVDQTTLQHEYVIQDNQSDWEFLQERAARIGCQVLVEDRTLRFRRADAAPPPAAAQEWGVSLLSFRARLTIAAQPGEVQVRGWDPQARQAVIGRAARPSQPPPIRGRQSAGAVSEHALGGPAAVVVGEQPVRTQAEAERLAQALLDELSGDYFTAEATCRGEPTIRAGAQVEVRGVGQRLAGAYFVTATRHMYTARDGYMTTFYVAGRRPTGLLAAIAPDRPRHSITGVAVAIVTNIEDPDRLGRVRLRFPWLDDHHESDWVRLAVAGAARDRGIFAAPQVDDEVLVAFEHGDIARPYVIGGLWNGQDRPPDSAVKDGRRLTLIRTAAGQLLALDDAADEVTLVSGAHTIALRQSGVSITSDSNLDLVAKGTLTIKGKLVKIN